MAGTELFLDTAYTIALSAPGDLRHAQAVTLATWIESSSILLVTTRAVMLEIGNALAKLNPMNDELKVSIISPPDREYLTAEIMFDNEQWAELNQERGYLSLLFNPRRDGQPWQISYQSAVEALEKARARLVGNIV